MVDSKPSLQENWRNEQMRKNVFGGVRLTNEYEATMSQAYGLFRPRFGGIKAVRHVFKPSVDLTYGIRNISEGGLIGFGSPDGNNWEQSSRVNIKIDNAIWAKINGIVEDQKFRVLQFNLVNGYDLHREKMPIDDLVCNVVLEGSQFFDSRIASTWYDDVGHLQKPSLQVEIERRQDMIAMMKKKVVNFRLGRKYWQKVNFVLNRA